MSPTSSVSRTGEYAERGDYHRELSKTWEFYPTYVAKMAMVREYLSALPARTRVLDAGCGEGILVDEFHARLDIVGVDPHYTSERVTAGSLTSLPFPDASFDRGLCLDVLEHLPFSEQAPALAELFRVVRPRGELLVSVPNLSHLQSRVHFLLRGRLIHTASLAKHPGDRPAAEFIDLARAAGFQLAGRRGIFPTVPILTRWIRKSPARLVWLHRALTRLIPVPGWCFLNVLRFERP